jgi:hypoxanthine phosphoribosyltransferase
VDAVGAAGGPLGEVVVSAADIQRRIGELGRQITEDYRDDPPLLICVLKGAFLFLADLARAIDLAVEVDFMAVSSYGSATKTSGVVRIVKDLDLDLTGPPRPAHRGHRRQRAHASRSCAATSRRGTPTSLEVCALLVREASEAPRPPLHRLPGAEHLRRRLRARRRRALPEPARHLRVGGRRLTATRR